MSQIYCSSFRFTNPLNLFLVLISILFNIFLSINFSQAQDPSSSTLSCYIKSGFQLYNDENKSSVFDSITPNGKTLCRSVGKDMYIIKFNGRNLYIEASAVKKTIALKSTDPIQPLNASVDESTEVTASSETPTLVNLRRTEGSSFSELAGQKITVLPGKWVPVRTEPNQDSRFECPISIVSSLTKSQANTICSQVESIDRASELTLTGERVFDKDNKNWYVEASFDHNGRTFTGWFDEKQTTLKPNEENIRLQTAEQKAQEFWDQNSEISLSSISEYKLDSSETAYQERAKMLFGLQTDPSAFKPVKQTEIESEEETTEHTTKFGPPVCGCVARSCRVSSGYGPRESFRTSNGKMSSSNHRAWDISSGTGTPIVAISDGRVISAGWKSGWGRTIEVDHGNGLIVRYSHLNSYTVKSGKVKRGQQIATMGSSGNVSGTHLDIGFKLNGVSKNPANYISSKQSFLNQSCGAVR